MRKRDELTNPASCMSRAKDDEMTFVLLGRDAAAPAAIRAWIRERIKLGKNKLDDPQITEACECAEQMQAVPVSAPPVKEGTVELEEHVKQIIATSMAGINQPLWETRQKVEAYIVQNILAKVPVSAPVPERTNEPTAAELGQTWMQEMSANLKANVAADKVRRRGKLKALAECGPEIDIPTDADLKHPLAAPVPEPEPRAQEGVCDLSKQLHQQDCNCVNFVPSFVHVPARKDELGTCKFQRLPHTEADHEAMCNPVMPWTPVAPQASPEPAKEMVILRPCKCGHGWESHEPGRCNESGCRCEEFRQEASPEAPADYRKLPEGAWFFYDSPNCLHRYSVQRRTEGGCSIVCSTPYTHDGAKRDMQEIVRLHEEARARLGLSGRAE